MSLDEKSRDLTALSSDVVRPSLLVVTSTIGSRKGLRVENDLGLYTLL